MTCIIIEDQPPAQRILKNYISQTSDLQLLGAFSQTAKANEFLKNQHVDLIFLDIHLPRVSGIDFLKRLAYQVKVIITTAFSGYALEGYELNVTDYLLKPFSYSRFNVAVRKAIDGVANEAYKNEVFIKSGHTLIKVVVSDISHIMSNSDYTEIYEGSVKHLSSESLKYWTECLDPKQFVRIHKSYIVNLSYIKKVIANKVLINEEDELPLGRAYKNDFLSLLI